jgi:hypothetical protein
VIFSRGLCLTRMTRYLMTAAVAASLLFAGGAEAKSLKGTVVHRNHKAHSFVVANAKGRLASVHATRNPKVGRRVAFNARALRNGTFSTHKLRFHGRSDGALVRGTVTFVDAATRTFTVSDNGASILVHLADTTKTLPAVGDAVLVTADLATSTASQLEATDVVINPAADAARPIEIEGVVLSINESTRTLTLSADDDHESGQMIAVTLPASFDLTQYKVGDSVELHATLNPDGQTYTATESSSDECDHHGNLEDHHQSDQGDDEGDHHDQGDDESTEDNSGTPGTTPTTPDDNSGPGSSGDSTDD